MNASDQMIEHYVLEHTTWILYHIKVSAQRFHFKGGY
jgi:hypothetical protein